jgi:phosphate ABC transporter phosphate-binding protein
MTPGIGVPRLLLALALCVALVVAAPAGAASSHAQISGSGSSWAYNAVNQWIADVNQRGLQVVFTSTGSATGRQDFANKTNDFAVSDIGYQGQDPLTHTGDSPGDRSFAYLPIVAGGTAFPYQIRVGGQLVRNLRLSGQTLAKIFTNQITSWDDPAVTADNNGRALPPIPIVPVVHSEGSGSTAQFTTYLDNAYPNIWRPFAGGAGFTEYFPRKGGAVAQNGSDGVMNFISAGGSNGAIGFDEFSYALGQNFPVAKVENTAGFFTLPTQYNVAVALTQAAIDTADVNDPLKYLTQDLSRVYVYNDPRTYPLSSYSYGIIPTGASDKTMSTAKRQTLVDYLFYSICDGQKEMGPIGYSPLPINLVQDSIDQIGKLKAADPGVDIASRDVASCNNPTFIAGHPERNYLAEIAPQPDPCDQSGQGPCTDTRTVLVIPGTPGSGGGSTSGGGQGSASGGSASGGSGGSASAGSSGSTARGTTGATNGKATAKGSTTGKGPGGSASSSAQAGAAASATGTAAAPVASRTSLADGPPSTVGYRSAAAARFLGVMAVCLLLIVLVAPPVLILLLRRRPKEDA